MSRRRELLLNLLLSLASIVVCLLAAEIVLRFLPVSTGLRSMPVTAADPVLHFTPNRPFVNSLGWNLHNVVHGRVNNAGFVNDQDYVRDGPPLIAVIGNSFIEAQMVAYPQTLQGRLAAALKDKFRVYSFAGSGAPLSQYLIWAGYAVKEYGARAVVINVVGNDFDESLAALPRRAGLLAVRAGCERRVAARADAASGRHADLACATERARALCHHQPRHPEPAVLDPLARRNDFRQACQCAAALRRQYRCIDGRETRAGLACRDRRFLSRCARTRRPAAGARAVHPGRIPQCRCGAQAGRAPIST